MNKCRLSVLAALTLFVLAAPVAGRADTLTIGYLSFDVGFTSAVNQFDLSDFTGSNAQSSTDVITDGELFSGMLTLSTSASQMPQTITFSGVDFNGSTLFSLASTIDVYSAVLSLTLSGSSGVNIYDSGGNAAVVDLQAVGDTTLSPLSPATSLVACDGVSPCANSVITVDTAPASAVTPEPETLWLVLSGVGGMTAFARRLRRV